MFEKNLRMAYLLDFYGNVLDEHTKSVMEAYYDDDLSLGEIAVGEGISRQGIRHIIKRGEEHLTFLEEKLGLAAQHERLSRYTEELSLLKERLSESNDSEGAHILEEVIEQITSKGF